MPGPLGHQVISGNNVDNGLFHKELLASHCQEMFCQNNSARQYFKTNIVATITTFG